MESTTGIWRPRCHRHCPQLDVREWLQVTSTIYNLIYRIVCDVDTCSDHLEHFVLLAESGCKLITRIIASEESPQSMKRKGHCRTKKTTTTSEREYVLRNRSCNGSLSRELAELSTCKNMELQFTDHLSKHKTSNNRTHLSTPVYKSSTALWGRDWKW